MFSPLPPFLFPQQSDVLGLKLPEPITSSEHVSGKFYMFTEGTPVKRVYSKKTHSSFLLGSSRKRRNGGHFNRPAGLRMVAYKGKYTPSAVPGHQLDEDQTRSVRSFVL